MRQIFFITTAVIAIGWFVFSCGVWYRKDNATKMGDKRPTPSVEPECNIAEANKKPPIEEKEAAPTEEKEADSEWLTFQRKCDEKLARFENLPTWAERSISREKLYGTFLSLREQYGDSAIVLVQIIQGQILIAGPVEITPQAKTLLHMILDTLAKNINNTQITDVEFLVCVKNYTLTELCFTTATVRGLRNLLIPELWRTSFTQIQRIKRIPRPWRTRKAKAAWRGGNTGFFPNVTSDFTQFTRGRLAVLGRLYPKLLDVGLTSGTAQGTNWKAEITQVVPMAKKIPLTGFSAYKYLVDVDGWTWSSRFAFLPAFNGVVLKQNSEWYGWSDLPSLYRPCVDYLPIEADLSDLVPAIKWLQRNDKKAKAIADSGAKRALQVLDPQFMANFWFDRLDQWRGMLDYTHVERYTSAVPLDMFWPNLKVLPKKQIIPHLVEVDAIANK